MGEPREDRVIGGGHRLPWTDVPEPVRTAVESILGSAVVEAASQPGGFSPGSADRVLTAAGRRAFVKAVSGEANPDAPGIYRSEARVLPELVASLPVPALLGVVEQDDWVALVLEDIHGRHPTLPWRPTELESVLDALALVSAEPVSDGLAALLPPLPDQLSGMFSGWTTVDESTLPALPDRLGSWCRQHLDDLRRMAVEALVDVAGDRLVHLDSRADNLLIRPDGSVAIVDWPWAAIGAPWFDALTLLINARLYDPDHPVDGVLAHPVFAGLPDGAVERVLAGLAGFFVPVSMQPPPPGLPTVRAFQRDQGIVTLQWLRERW